jgi:DNA-binding transcriptional MerR regulator
MEYGIRQVVDATGLSSRTLRHYDAIGLLPAARDASGYRCYTRADLVRLQRIVVMRDLGLPLASIRRVLEGDTDDVAALRDHLADLRRRRALSDKQIARVERTIQRVQRQEELMPDEMFEGFDHTQYRDEVQNRWGEQAFADADRWWRGIDGQDKQGFMDEHAQIAVDWAAARNARLSVDSEPVREIAERHARWIARGWGGRTPTPEALVGLAQMYVDDERFAANYGGVEGATYVRDALTAYARSM